MKHYPHHIGDFDKATRHLTRIERSIYRDLIDLYYDTEQQISLDMVWVCRKIIARSNEESTAVEQVLNEFFTKTATGWYQERCEAEIEAYRANNSQKAQAGKASAAAKAAKKEQALNATSTAVEQPLNSRCIPVADTFNGTSTNQEPRTKNQEPLIPIPPIGGCPVEPQAVEPDPKVEKGVFEKIETGFPDCPYAELLKLWATHLPHLTQPRVWEGARKTAMRQRWIQAAKPSAYSPKGYATEADGIAWWRSFFEYITTTQLAVGFESNGRSWQPDLQWVCKQENFQKIIDGKYEK